MAENVPQSTEVPVALELFGSLVTEMSPSDLPEGISPDNQDVVFLPGGVRSRPGTQRLYGLIAANTTITYEKTFIRPDGVPVNIIVCSSGQIFTEILGMIAPLGTVAPGCYCNSVSAFGKEYFTFHDGLTGVDVPRQFDGTFFDRFTQGGPGAPPSLTNLIIQQSTLAAIPAPPVEVIVNTQSFRSAHVGSLFGRITVTVTAPTLFLPGDLVTIAGNSNALSNGTFVIDYVGTGIFNTQFGYAITPTATNPGGAGGTATRVSAGNVLIRGNNIVSGQTATPHGLQVGYRAQISGVDPSIVGGVITSIVIDNENFPGLALVTTSLVHGLLPQNEINIVGVNPVAVGGGIASVTRAGQVVTAITSGPHGLSMGATVNIAGVTSATYNGQFQVLSVIDPNTFTYAQADADGTSTGGTVSLVWPNTTGTLTPSLFTVDSAPTAHSFYINFSYADGTWTGGTITFAWDGTFFISAVPTSTSFKYLQYGPNASSTVTGTLTPIGQASPGPRNAVTIFVTRQGYITAPSPPTLNFLTNGGQYVSVSNIAIGPANVIARIIAFTGANGGNYFYIPVPAQVSGQIVSTSTYINDNITTNAIFDFSDNTLLDSTAIDITGNNLFEMQTVGPCLGVLSYASRIGMWGMANAVPNLVNMGFEGGFFQSNPNQPLGWNVVTAGGTLNSTLVDFGSAWRITGDGTGNRRGEISQPVFQDAFGIPVLLPSTLYTMNLWAALAVPAMGTDGFIRAEITSQSTGFVATASLPLSGVTNPGAFFSFVFDIQLPVIIPPDMVLNVFMQGAPNGVIVAIDEMQTVPTANPFTTTFSFSYVNKPEALDGLTGLLGATADDSLLQTYFVYRDALHFLTQRGLHETTDIGGIEPANWRIREVSQNCGASGPRSCSTGENFSAWITSASSQPPTGRGLYVYTGGSVYKVSQEIQPDFDRINPLACQNIWVQNDPITRRIYCGLPLDTATAPNVIYVLDYRELDTASDIANRGPIHISFSGKMVCSDLSRKWTRWSLPTNYGGIIRTPTNGVQFVICGGNGEAPSATGIPQSYWFDDNKLTDDDFGQIVPYYVSYFFVNHEAEQQLQVGFHRKLFKRYSSYITGVGFFVLTPFANTLGNPWPAPPHWPLNADQFYDIGDGLNIITERCAFKVASIPVPGQTDNAFNMGKLIITLCQEPVSPIRFGAI